MIALPGVGGSFHFPEQRIHFLAIEPPSGPDRGVTGHGGGDIVDPVLEPDGLVEFAQFIGEVAHQTGNIGLAQDRWNLADHHGAGALDKKLASVRCYKSQFPPAKEYVFDRIHAFALQQGMLAGMKAGETLTSPRALGTRDLMKLAFG